MYEAENLFSLSNGQHAPTNGSVSPMLGSQGQQLPRLRLAGRGWHWHTRRKTVVWGMMNAAGGVTWGGGGGCMQGSATLQGGPCPSCGGQPPRGSPHDTKQPCWGWTHPGTPHTAASLSASHHTCTPSTAAANHMAELSPLDFLKHLDSSIDKCVLTYQLQNGALADSALSCQLSCQTSYPHRVTDKAEDDIMVMQQPPFKSVVWLQHKTILVMLYFDDTSTCCPWSSSCTVKGQNCVQEHFNAKQH